MKQLTKVSQVTEYTAKITADDIRKAFNLPDLARVQFCIPGGGDWSNMSLDIDEHPLSVSYAKTENFED